MKEIKPKSWGMLTSLDLHDCDPELIRSADAIKRYVVELCDLIRVKRFGETNVVHFGEREEVAGFSMVQLIESSLVSGHFANKSNSAYIDIFSCRSYNADTTTIFSQRFFRARKVKKTVLFRD